MRSSGPKLDSRSTPSALPRRASHVLAAAFVLFPALTIPEAAAARDTQPHGVELLVIDERVPFRAHLLDGLRPDVEVLLVAAEDDSIRAIETALNDRTAIGLHIVAHGRPGAVELGDSALDADRIRSRASTLTRWFSSTQVDGRPAEIHLYACRAASGLAGLELLSALSAATGAHVAASVHTVGGDAAAATWALETKTGTTRLPLPIDPSTARAYPAALETFLVTNTNGSGPGSLAEAVADANANGNPEELDDIVFTAECDGLGCTPSTDGSVVGTITLDATLEILEPLAIEGPGVDALIVDGNGGRAVEVRSALHVRSLSVVNAATPTSGAAFLVVDGTLYLDEVRISESVAGMLGGAIAADEATVVVDRSDLRGNVAEMGGAIFVSASSLDVSRSNFSENEAAEVGGAIAIDGSTASIEDTALHGNRADAEGGAIYVGHDEGGPPLVSIQNSTLSSNRAARGGGLVAEGLSYVEVVHTTVTANSSWLSSTDSCLAAGIDGCGLSLQGIVVIESSIVAGNFVGPEGTETRGVDVAGDDFDLEIEIRSSLIEWFEGGAGISGAPIFDRDALLGPLGDHGGNTFTHPLLAESPAIDRGENPASAAYDQRGAGFARVLGLSADMGAYEASPSDGAGGSGEPSPSVDGGSTGLEGGAGGNSSGCGCTVAGGGPSERDFAVGAAGLLAMLLIRRRR